MNIVIKYDPSTVLWFDAPGSGIGLYVPLLESPVADIETAKLQQLLELAEPKQYEDRGISPCQLAKNIAREVATIAPLFPKSWAPAQIEVSRCFADALGLKDQRIDVAGWIERYSIGHAPADD